MKKAWKQIYLFFTTMKFQIRFTDIKVKIQLALILVRQILKFVSSAFENY